MKTMIWLIGETLTLVLVSLWGLAALLLFVSLRIDLSPYKADIAREVQGRTGLLLQVDGPLYVQTGPLLGVQAGSLRIRSADGTRTHDLLSAGHIALQVKTLPLFSRIFEPRLLELETVRLHFEPDASGKGSSGAETAGSAGEDHGGFRLVADHLRLRVRDLSMDYKDAGLTDPLRVRVESADVEPAGAGLRIGVDASVDEHPLRLKGTTATLSQLIAGDTPVPIDLDGELLGLSVRAEGKLVNPRSGGEIAAKLRVQGKSLSGLAPWLGNETSKVGPVKAAVQVAGTKGRYRVEPFDISLGDERLTGTAALDLTGKKPKARVSLSVNRLDLRPFLSRPEAGRARGAKKPGRALFDTEPLSLGWMDSADVTADVKLQELETPYTTLKEIDADIALRDRRLSVAAKGKTADGRRNCSTDLSFNGAARLPHATLRLTGEKLPIEPLLAMTQSAGLIRGDVDVSAELETSGGSADRMAAALKGKVAFLIENAEADVKGMDRLVGGVNALVGQLVTPNEKLAKVNCGLAALDFAGGRSQVKGLLDTPYSTVVAQGELDLGAETISLRVSPTPKGVTLSVASPVSIQGSLRAPVVEVEKGGLLLTLTDLLSKVAVPHLVLVDAFGSAVSTNPCVKIASGQIDQRRYGPVGTALDGTGEVLKGTGEVLRGVGGAVQDLLGGGAQGKQ